MDGHASGPALTSLFMVVLKHSALVGIPDELVPVHSALVGIPDELVPRHGDIYWFCGHLHASSALSIL